MLLNLGNVYIHREDYLGATSIYAQALAQSRALHSQRYVAIALLELGVAAYYLHEPRKASELCAEALTLFCQMEHVFGQMTLLALTAAVSLQSGDAETAALLCGAVERQCECLSRALRTIYQQIYMQTCGVLRETLDPVSLAQAWQAGRALALAEACARCQEVLASILIAQPLAGRY
jgi:hypothetical protein